MEEVLRLVYRNHGNGRKDAAYVILVTEEVVGGKRKVAVYGLYGPWATFDTGMFGPLPGNVKDLRGWDKPKAESGDISQSLAVYVSIVAGMHAERRDKGYVLRQDFTRGHGYLASLICKRVCPQFLSSVKPATEPEPVSQPAPKPAPKPASKPAIKPAPKPAPAPEPAPVEKDPAALEYHTRAGAIEF